MSAKRVYTPQESMDYATGAVKIADRVGVREGAEQQYWLMHNHIALAAELAKLREENSELVSCVSDLLLASCNLSPAFYKRCQDALSKAKGRAG